MDNLIINRIAFQLSDKIPDLYLLPGEGLTFRMLFKAFSNRVESFDKDQQPSFQNIEDEDFISFSFTKPKNGDYIKLEKSDYPFNYFKPKYIRELLFSYFSDKGFIIRKFPTGYDLSVLNKIKSYNEDWDIYRRIDFSIKHYRNEIAFNIGSKNTIISKKPIRSHEGAKIIENGEIRHLKEDENDDFITIANREKRDEIGIKNSPRKLSYSSLFSELKKFYEDNLIQLDNDKISIQSGGLKPVELKNTKKVKHSGNLMLFNNEKTDINAFTGLRDYGIYKASSKASKTKFIFIYKDKGDANTLYLNLKNGLKHYPGLLSYVGIPITTLDKERSYQYNSIEELRENFDSYIEKKFPDENYDDYFAIIIQPFTKQEREEVDEGEDELYYLLKHKLLEKGVPSQFIQNENIHSSSFHYYLPNISIAILAKLGGIPWRLKSKRKNELVIGFNQARTEDEKYIGSAVFFSNEGELGKTVGFTEKDNESALIANLKQAIESYIEEKQEKPERLIIHYYKPQSHKEQQLIEDLIQKELRLNLPFSIVEINDTKSHLDICFDSDFKMGMPISGTYVRLNKNTYLLFNNTRYESRTIRNIKDELPIKIKIHFADMGGFSHSELISQVYEFSRLYWKGLKQRSQPVTTIYSKLIADFALHHKGKLPDNATVNALPWFL